MRRKKPKRMDRLTRMAIIADNLGMSYGKLEALIHEGLMPEIPEDAPDPVPKLQKRCRICGAPVEKGRKLYCSWDCEHAAANARAREAHRRKRYADNDRTD